MKNHVTKEPKIALCRKCHGKGVLISGRFIKRQKYARSVKEVAV